MKKTLIAGLTIGCALLLCGCSSSLYYDINEGMVGDFNFEMNGMFEDSSFGDMDGNNYQYDRIVEQGFQTVSEQASSYFSLDRNTANYSLVRAQLKAGYNIAADSVRIEELVNYFSYDYPAPAEGEEVAVSTYLASCPWNAEHKLMTVGIRTAERMIESEKNNYVFLIDVSGSMSWRVDGSNMSRLDMLKYGIDKLVEGLGENDRVSIATYASGVKTVLEPTLATNEGKVQIMNAVNSLESSGSTNGAGGLQLAYDLAQRGFSDGGNNRVILMTDGDFNVGIRRQDQLEEFIRDKAKGGVYLSVLGVGLGNMRDDLMQTLALAGNGNYAYIDSEREAQKALCEELNGMLYTVAKDVKAGVTFTDMVGSYRIIGYDMKLMSEEDFNDENKDAGEIGSNLNVTVMYELELSENVAENAMLASVEIRYKSVDTEESCSVTASLLNAENATNDTAFAACVAEFGLVLRKSDYKAEASLYAILSRLEKLADYTAADFYKTEFVTLVQTALASEQYGN